MSDDKNDGHKISKKNSHTIPIQIIFLYNLCMMGIYKVNVN
jgi:hypothetical protein